MKILFLTPWYPSERDAMAGLFVQKHADAVRAQGCDVRVIHSQNYRDTWHQWHALQREGWMPDVVQLNVIQKQGLLALWLKKRYRIPYVIIEHWSGYLPENGQFMQMPALKRKLYLRMAKEAEMVLTVSQPLQKAMQQCGIDANKWGTVDNVVDDFFSEEREVSEGNRQRTLLHVSCFDEQAKNIKGLLRAFRVVCLRRSDVRLVLIGAGVDFHAITDLADELEFPEGAILFTGELTPREVAGWLHRADAFVLSSRYETYGVVLAEAAAAGVPILSSPVGIAEEVAELIVPQEIAQNNPRRFAEFMETILGRTEQRPKNKDFSRFTAEAIGEKLKGIYEQVCTCKI